MAVAFDAESTGWTNVSSTSLSHTLMTVGTGGSNYVLIACILFSAAAAPAGLAVTWGAQTMTAIPSTTVNNATLPGTMILYGLVAPTSGNQTLSVTWTAGTNEVHACCISFTGASQTSVAVAFPNGTTQNANVTNGTLVITSNVGDMVNGWWSDNATTFSGSDTTGTNIQFQNTGPNLGSVGMYDNGASPSVTCTVTTGTTNKVGSGCDIAVFVAAGAMVGILVAHG